MIEKKIVIGKLDILEDGQLQVRQDTVYTEDGVESFRKYHRLVLSPGDDIKDYDKKIQDVAGIIWTKEVVDEFKRKQEGNQLPISVLGVH